MTDERSGAANPWVALRPGDDPSQLAQRASSAHSSFLDAADTSVVPASVRSVVRESWLRSRRNGISPDAVEQPSLLTGLDLERYRAGHPMALIRPVVRKLLVEDAADSGLLVAISDEQGRLLWVEGDHAARDRALSMSFVEGADWSEERVGTNAPGTALAVDHSVQIVAAEHFNRTVHEWSCSAAPVHDPSTGRILGAIDITGGLRVAAPEVLQLVRATVAAAESELRLHLLSSPRLLSAARTSLDTFGSGRPTLHRDGERIPLSQRHAEILLLLAEHPEGLSSDRLAVLLDEAELDSVTIRAEMSRLRKVFGPEGLGSRPYRLLGELVTDVAEVRGALDRGDVATAVRLYAGPVLPGSAAPGIEEIRDELRARVQAALLRAGDAQLLARWTASVHGRDDIAAWEAYLTTLDPHSTLFAQVKARIELLDRQLGI
ncbi:transcriptional regulator [Rhodococcus sp. WB1]|uniref:helix-turn-helix domain-containing protein n=1 Tax=Rhodococcus TaxID=1827 RepID=UPI00081A4B45|nr:MULTISPECIES: helix-turn-helix domain-containing protein [Rhodococcus]ANZ24347.1 transcriptional regulator [Rhodococcus sp. WB1]MDV6293910.1 transcriptional regulator [Rhodococcus aetherivorans]OLL16886.1 transcriptional regulator [Rhodococcus sp. M8]QIX51422.1 transcriptional regulator [Rhodococcus sp. DMU1]QPG46958.1 transcriptional regulator [Rhodococcus sp. M8]